MTSQLSEDKNLLIARLLSGKTIIEESEGPTSIKALNRDAAPLALSYGQQRLWFLAEFEPESPAYNVPLAVRLKGALDTEALKRSILDVVDRHEVLRGRIERGEEEGVMVVEPEIDLGWQVEEVHSDQLTNCIQAEIERPFNLQCGPLVRSKLLKLEEEDHVWLVTFHHIVTDGWSTGIFMRELAEFYRGYVNGQLTYLAALPIQYADYAAWQRKWLSGERLDRELGYWKDKLGGDIPLLDLVTDRPRPAVKSYQGGSVNFQLSQELSEKLRALGRRLSSTLYMTLLAAFRVLLHRYSGQEDVWIGSPIAGRNRPEVEGLIGFFVNTLVMRNEVAGGESFLEVLKRERETTLEAYQHAEVPFEMLVEVVASERDMSRSALFQVMFSLQTAGGEGTGGGGERLEGLASKRVGAEWVTSKFDLNLEMGEGLEGLQGSFEYSSDLFEVGTIKRMVNHFKNLLESIVSDPEQEIGKLELMHEEEKHQLLVGLNDTAVDYPRDKIVTDLFEEQVERHPDKMAVGSEGKHLTYAELGQKSGQLANRLKFGLDIRPGMYVGVLVERGVDMVTAILGILRSGGAYVPIDTRWPEKRIGEVIDGAGLKCVVCSPRLVNQVPESVLTIDVSSVGGGVDFCGEAMKEKIQPDTPAYAIFTSGSTGRPKGVSVGHAALTNFLYSMRDFPGFSEEDTLLAVTSLAFDISILEILLPLVLGGSVIIASKDEVYDAEALSLLIEDKDITFMQATPATWQMMVMSGWKGHKGLKTLCGGEALSRDLADRLLERTDTLWNMYGPTETTIWSTMIEVDADEDVISIGRPISNTQVYVVDSNLKPVPIGIAGELLIGGFGLAEGYLNQPELTSEAFIDNPFVEGAKVYRTGDLCRWRDDGKLEYLSRMDSQIKLRGHRIELKEVEAVLAKLEGVSASAARLHDDGSGSKVLCGYVVYDGEWDPRAMKEIMGRMLPSYMVPSYLECLDEIPLTTSGKVDRKVLPKPEGAGGSGVDYVAPRNETEVGLVEIWEEVLGRKQVGVNDDFFHLGGHSLLVLKLISSVRQQFGVDVPVRKVFEHSDIAALAKVIKKSRKEEGMQYEDILPFQGSPVLSYAQERMWFMWEFDHENAAYNMPFAWSLRGELNQSYLLQAIERLIDRHDILRTCYQVNEFGECVPILGKRLASSVEFLEVSDEAEARGIASREASGSFQLDSEIPIRVKLIKLSDANHVLLMTLHHICGDGWSMEVLRNELSELYEALYTGRDSELKEIDIKYSDYAAWQRRWLTRDVFERQLEYWKNKLGGDLPVLDLPQSGVRSRIKGSQGNTYALSLDEDLRFALEQIARTEGVTLFMLFLAAYRVLLSKYNNHRDVIVGTPVSGRYHVQTQNLVGLFINTLALRGTVEPRSSFREHLQWEREIYLEADENQDIPFEMLVNELETVRDVSRTPIFQTMFAYGNRSDRSVQLYDLKVGNFTRDWDVSKFDISLFVNEASKGFRVVFEYDTDLFDEQSLRCLGESYRILLQQIANNVECRVAQLNVLSKGDRETLLDQFNDTAMDYPADKTVMDLFEEWLEQYPDKPAVACGGFELSYRDLDNRASKLAACLAREHTIEPGGYVGILMERSPDMVATVLGVLKSGAAYVPLDPRWPEERVRMVVEGAGLKVVVCSKVLLDKLPEGLATVDMSVVADRDDLPACGESASGVESSAYAIFTSGSTGRPKGVGVGHAALSNFLHSMQVRPGFEANDKLLAVTSLSFDISILEILLPLVSGGCVVIAREEEIYDAGALARLIEEHGITVMQATPATWQMLVVSGWVGDEDLKALCGGEALGGGLAGQLLERTGSLWNMYGPTETTIWSTLSEVVADGGEVTIGRPIGNTQIYIVSPDMELLPRGVAGELLIGGAGVAQGYLGQPDLTTASFIENPFTGVGRVYKTGDLCRWREDGNLEYLGRMDGQVKLRGHRIELQEVESVLAGLEGVKASAARLHEDGSGGKVLCGYVVSEGEWDPRGMKKVLGKVLPSYMVPGFIERLNEMPLTTSGKVDRKVLPKPDGAGESGVDYVAARNETEAELVKIWEQVLGREKVGVYDDFFHLGGHSLLAIKLLNKVVTAFDWKVSLNEVFHNFTIARIADLLRNEKVTEEISGVISFNKDASGFPLFIIPGAGGNYVAFRELVKSCGSQTPIHILVPDGWDDRARPFSSMDEMIERYISYIVELSGERDFNLFGWCTGGIVGAEIASRLEKKQTPPSHLVLVDSFPKVTGASSRGRSRFSRGQKLQNHLKDFAKRPISYVSEKLMIRWRMAKHFGRKQKIRMYRAVGMKMPVGLREWDIMYSESIFIRDLAPGSYGGRAFILWSSEDPDWDWLKKSKERRAFDPDVALKAWKNLLTGEINLEMVSGDHTSIFHKQGALEMVEKLRHRGVLHEE